jgi:peroxiredoxin Q/BCP
VAYFAASCDTPDTNKQFAESLKLDYPILSDPGREVAQRYGLVADAAGLPKRWTFIIGSDGKIVHIDKQVKPDTHGTDLATKLKELKVDKGK